MAVPLAGILTFDGIDTNSIGLYVIAAFPSLPVELFLDSGPQITADCFAKLKSSSRSWGPLFLNGILNF